MTTSKHLTIQLTALRLGAADVMLDRASACLCVPLMRVSPDAHRVPPEDHLPPSMWRVADVPQRAVSVTPAAPRCGELKRIVSKFKRIKPE